MILIKQQSDKYHAKQFAIEFARLHIVILNFSGSLYKTFWLDLRPLIKKLTWQVKTLKPY
jgi:hypothetical protein